MTPNTYRTGCRCRQTAINFDGSRGILRIHSEGDESWKGWQPLRRETRLALKLFVWKAHRLRDGRYLRFLQEQGGTKLTLSYTRGKDGGDSSVTIDHQRPDDDATDAFVLNFRFFIHGREQSSFGWLAKHVLDDPDLSDDWKQAFTSARDQVNTFLDSPSPFIEKVVDPNSTSADGPQLVGEYHWTNRQIMDVFINGGMAHAEVPKWEIFERWRSNQLGFSPMLDHFDLIITTVVHAIAFVCGWCEQELAALEADPRSQAEGNEATTE